MKYHPVGKRGVALQVAHDRYRPGAVADKFVAANQRTTLFCQIETAEGVENADAMAAIDGVDCLWVGHFDLSVSLGIPGEFDHPDFKARDRAGSPPPRGSTTRRSAAWCRPSSRASRSTSQGFDFICYSGDVWVLHNALAEAIGEAARRRASQVGRDDGRASSASRSRAISGRPTARRPIPISTWRRCAPRPASRWRSSNRASPLRAEQLEDFDALILLAHRFAPESVPKSGRLAVVARFGVGYDTVDVEACTEAGIALVITPDGVRRPVAVSIMTLMLALTGKLMVKDRLTREAAAGYAKRSDHMGVGLVGRTLGSLGIGNIGAEVFRLAKPFDMKFIAHDPFADKAVAAELGIELVGLEELFRRADVALGQLPADAGDPPPRQRRAAGADEADRLSDQHRARADRRPEGADRGAAGAPHRRRRARRARAGAARRRTIRSSKLDNVILAPHALCWTDQCFAGNGAADVKAVLDVQHGRVPRGVVNREVLDDRRLEEAAGGLRRALRRLSRARRASVGDRRTVDGTPRQAARPRQRPAPTTKGGVRQ